MPCLRITRSIRPQVLPKDGISLDRLEGDPRHILILSHLAVQELTPLVSARHLQTWKIRAPAFALIS